MTLAAFISVKGSPGVTTLACLVGATWPAGRRVVVAECDPSGGDLAARFSLSGKTGWLSLTALSRRDEAGVSVEPHLQQLPGGLEVLVGFPGGAAAGGGQPARQVAERVLWHFARDGEADVILDLGRLSCHEREPSPWLSLASTVCIVLRSDAASILHVQERSGPLQERCGNEASLVVVGSGPYSSAEIERFTEMRVAAEIPDDPVAAGVVTMGRGSERRLARSGLAASARRLAHLLVAGSDTERCRADQAVPSPEPDPRVHDEAGGRGDRGSSTTGGAGALVLQDLA
ncbi:MAG: hypothetical protein ACYCV7_16780 [Acidimicrobiales bacterium]